MRETLIQTGKVGIANVVLRNKQHLAVVMPLGKALVMNTLRWADEVRGVEYLELKDEALDPDLAERELDMAKRLVEDMTEKWKPEQYKDTFQDQIMDLVEKKAREGKLEAVGGPEEAVDRRSADVIDLTELLKRSLAAKPGKARAAEAGRRTMRRKRRQPNPSQRARPRPASRPARHAHARHRRRAANPARRPAEAWPRERTALAHW